MPLPKFAKLCQRSFALAVLAVSCLAAGASAQNSPAPVVAKVEPPSWWATHTINPVRLLVRGANLHGARVTPQRAGTETSAVVVNPAGTYLFVSVTINRAASPGDYPLTIETRAGKATIPFRIEEPYNTEVGLQGITTDDVIYLIMPDRFADGEASNNAPAGSPREANDRRNPRAWHGGDFDGLTSALSYLRHLGVTAIWLTPWYDNYDGVKSCDKPWCPYTYYHGYHAIDYYAVENRFADNVGWVEEFVEKAHASGLKVIQDQVANHVGSQHPWVTDPPLDNWFHGTLARHTQNPFRADLLLSPYASAEARRPTLDGWFSDDLPDMNQDEPEVARYEIQNALWWAETTGIDGIRQDTIQYMPRTFIRELSRALHRQHPKLWMVGEVFDRDPAHTSFFLGGRTGWDGVDTELDAVFDFPVWQASLDAFTGKKPVRHLRDTLKYDALYTDASRLVTLTNNHDVKRFMSLEGATLEGAMLHMAFTLSIRGTPQLYYGEEFAFEGGDDPDNRRDFPGGFKGDAHDAFDPQTLTPRERRMFEWTRDWLTLRRENVPLRHGRMIDLFFDEDTYVFARQTAEETIILAFNRAAAPKKINAPAVFASVPDGAKITPLLVAKENGRVACGEISFTVPARTAVAYRVTK
ncbi:MAG TPA: alpha-amylase family glycosyl hydrolase [Pyrinomonadaceae bacterium]|nr:alpha-amylase family glycosyl hydrolase [Pyrinomonadaceae bacterium]